MRLIVTIIALCGWFAVCGPPLAIATDNTAYIEVAYSTRDAGVSSYDNVAAWTDICAGVDGTQVIDDNDPSHPVGTAKGGGTYTFSEMYCQFDLSAIDGTVTSASIGVWLESANYTGSGDFRVMACASDWYPIDVGDYKASATEIGSRAVGGIALGGYQETTITNASVQSHLGGKFPVVFRLTDNDCGIEPTGSHYINIYARDNGANMPYIKITYTPTPDGAGRHTFNPTPITGDGNLKGSGNTIENACAAAKDKFTTAINLTVGDRLKTGTYDSWRSFMRFDLTGITGTVESDTLFVYSLNLQDEDFVLQIYKLDADWWPLDDTDWDASGELVQSIARTDISNGAWNGWYVSPTPGEILSLRFQTSVQCDNGNAPSANRYVQFRSVDHQDCEAEGYSFPSTCYHPMLVVNTTDGTRHLIPAVVTTQPTVNGGLVRWIEGL